MEVSAELIDILMRKAVCWRYGVEIKVV